MEKHRGGRPRKKLEWEIGTIFYERIEILSKPYTDVDGKRKVEAKCLQCQKTFIPRTELVFKLKNCGCLRVGRLRPRQCNDFEIYRGELPKTIWNRFIKNAQRRGKCFNISLEEAFDVYEKQDRKCALSGVPIDFGVIEGISAPQRDKMRSASLDRIDSQKGYTIDNIQWVHKDVNFMKQQFSDEKFTNWCKLIADFARHQKG
jgi:hypothetical protein